MINIENQEIYAIYSTPKWIAYKTQLPIDSTYLTESVYKIKL